MPTTGWAVSFQQHAADSAANAHYDRPAVLAALGPLSGRQVLDAACGPGLYLRELLERGAEVTAFDASPVMVSLARQQTAGRVRIDQAALGKPLPYPDDAFDLIICALAIHYAGDRAAAFAEFCRVLRPGGAAVVSTQHPVMDWLRKGGSYFQATLETDIWRIPSGDQPVHFWREPLSALCTAATDAGFPIGKVIEPGPGRDNARTLSRGLRETEQGTRISDPAPSQARQADSQPPELTPSRTFALPGQPAKRSLIAAMSMLGFCPERRKPEIVGGPYPRPLTRKAARRSADQVRAPHYRSRRSAPQRRTRCVHRTAAPAHSTRTSTAGARQAAAAYLARGDECRARGPSTPGRYTTARPSHRPRPAGQAARRDQRTRARPPGCQGLRTSSAGPHRQNAPAAESPESHDGERAGIPQPRYPRRHLCPFSTEARHSPADRRPERSDLATCSA